MKEKDIESVDEPPKAVQGNTPYYVASLTLAKSQREHLRKALLDTKAQLESIEGRMDLLDRLIYALLPFVEKGQ